MECALTLGERGEAVLTAGTYRVRITGWREPAPGHFRFTAERDAMQEIFAKMEATA